MGFHLMRQRLIARGLIDESFTLTAKGNAEVDRLLAELREAEAPADSNRPRVRWNTSRSRAA